MYAHNYVTVQIAVSSSSCVVYFLFQYCGTTIITLLLCWVTRYGVFVWFRDPLWDTWTCGWIGRIVGGENLLPWFTNQATVSMWNTILYIFDSAYCMSWCLWFMWKEEENFLLPLPKHTRGSRGNSFWVCSRKSDISWMWKQDSVPIYTHTLIHL